MSRSDLSALTYFWLMLSKWQILFMLYSKLHFYDWIQWFHLHFFVSRKSALIYVGFSNHLVPLKLPLTSFVCDAHINIQSVTCLTVSLFKSTKHGCTLHYRRKDLSLLRLHCASNYLKLVKLQFHRWVTGSRLYVSTPFHNLVNLFSTSCL